MLTTVRCDVNTEREGSDLRGLVLERATNTPSIVQVRVSLHAVRRT